MTLASRPDLGIRSATELAASGVGRRARESALERGGLARVRRPWYALAGACPEAIAAVRMGGALTATSASRHHGLWTVDDDRLHVLLPRHGSRHAVDATSHHQPVCVHWATKASPSPKVLADPLQLVRDAAHCRPLEVAVVLADSALALRRFSRVDLEQSSPRVAAFCDASSQSGTESLCRFRLGRHGIRLRTQAEIPRVGRVDLLIGDRLVLECDSQAYHDGYHAARDYDRDLALIEQGFIVLRLQYRHVMFEWEKVEALVMAVVRSDRHLWRRGPGAVGTVLGL